MKSFKLILEGLPGSGRSTFLEEFLHAWRSMPTRMRRFHVTETGCLEHELRITTLETKPLPKED